jgi:hypothetical protein
MQNPEVCRNAGEEIHPDNQLPVILQKGLAERQSNV